MPSAPTATNMPSLHDGLLGARINPSSLNCFCGVYGYRKSNVIDTFSNLKKTQIIGMLSVTLVMIYTKEVNFVEK